MIKRILSFIIILGTAFFLVSCDLDFSNKDLKEKDKTVEPNYKQFLEDERVLFSLNKGKDYKLVDDTLEEFEIWNEQTNDEIESKEFFIAFTYEEFIIKIEEIKKLDYGNFFYYGYDKASIEESTLIYDDVYFEENILLFYYRQEANISENYVHSVTKKGDVLTLNVNRFEGMMTAISSWLEFVTIKKEDIKGITKIDLVLRTVSPLVEAVHAYVFSLHAREFYLNPHILEDFDGLENVKDIDLFLWSLNVDLTFNVEVTEEDLLNVVSKLENNPNIDSIGYKGRDFIRIQLKPRFYDEVIDKTIVIEDFIEDEDFIKQYKFTISVLKFSPIVRLSFILENKGKKYADLLIEELLKRNYSYLEIEEPNYYGIYN